jgi:ATP-dependent Clp protease adapter protein ClpS
VLKMHQGTVNNVNAPKAVVKEIPLNEPGGFNVMILNNEVTPFQVVIEALVSAVGLSGGEAAKRMMAAHTNGWVAVAAYGSKDIAESVASNIERHAMSNQNYDNLRRYVKHNGPWPLDTEVMVSGDSK